MVLRCLTDMAMFTQAYAPPPGYSVLKNNNNSTLEDISVRKRDKMRRWLCCTCQVEEPYQSNENELLKSPRNNTDGIFPWPSITHYCAKASMLFPEICFESYEKKISLELHIDKI